MSQLWNCDRLLCPVQPSLASPPWCHRCERASRSRHHGTNDAQPSHHDFWWRTQLAVSPCHHWSATFAPLQCPRLLHHHSPTGRRPNASNRPSSSGLASFSNSLVKLHADPASRPLDPHKQASDLPLESLSPSHNRLLLCLAP